MKFQIKIDNYSYKLNIQYFTVIGLLIGEKGPIPKFFEKSKIEINIHFIKFQLCTAQNAIKIQSIVLIKIQINILYVIIYSLYNM